MCPYDPALITQLPQCVAQALGPDPTAFAQLTGRKRHVLTIFRRELGFVMVWT